MSDIITTLHPENDNETNLYPNIKKENIPNGSVDTEKLSEDVNNILNGIDERLTNAIASITQPKYYNISSLPTSDVGLIVGSDGYIYSWNSTAYTSTGILYLASPTEDDSIDYTKLDLYNSNKFKNLAKTTNISNVIGFSQTISNSTSNALFLYIPVSTYGAPVEHGVYFVMLKYSLSNVSGIFGNYASGNLAIRKNDSNYYLQGSGGFDGIDKGVGNFIDKNEHICCGFINVLNDMDNAGFNIYFANMGTSNKSFTITFNDLIIVKTNLDNSNTSDDTTFHNIYKQYLKFGNQKNFITEFIANEEIYNPFRNKKLMTLGDSLTVGSYSWVNKVKYKLGFATATNLAIGGTKINVFADNVDATNIADIDYLTIMGYFNSATNSPGTVDDVASNDADASICANYKYLIDKILTLKPSIKLIIIIPHNVPTGFNQNVNCEAIRNIANYYHLPIIDIAKYGGFNSYTYSTYLRDSIHSSNAGYELEAELIAGGFKSYFG